MIDEASRKMVLVISGKGRAAGLQRTQPLDPGVLIRATVAAQLHDRRDGHRTVVITSSERRS